MKISGMVGGFDETVDVTAVHAITLKFIADKIAYFHGFLHPYWISGLVTMGDISSVMALLGRKNSAQ